MKKVARLRTSPIMSEDQRQQPIQSISNEPVVRTTGRIKKPKAVFDPSDNYLPRAQRLPAVFTTSAGFNAASNLSQDTRNSLSRMSTASSDNISVSKEVCVVCGKRESKRTSFAIKNPLLSCLECESKIHRLCLKADFDDVEHIRHTYRCESCTPCVICLKNSQTVTVDNNKILICSKCSNVYHSQCLQPGSSKQKEDSGRGWKCPKCALHLETTNEDDLPVKKIREIIGDHAGSAPPSHKSVSTGNVTTSSGGPTSCESGLLYPNETDIQKETDIHSDERSTGQVSNIEDCSQMEKKEPHISSPTPHTVANLNDQLLSDFPDVQHWSVIQVFEYFKNYFPKEAHVFKDQEIDGRSLLLLKRSDVVKKLPLKLGPSLRIYSAILKIQGQQNDPTMGWNCIQ